MRNNENIRSIDWDIGALSGHLWEAANIDRGPVDAADLIIYIFSMLFFKRQYLIYLP